MLKSSLIWNIPNKCPYSCSFCCIDANSSREDLSLEEKLKIVENIDVRNIKIDVSGGDPLIIEENLDILKLLSRKLGKEAISVTTTGKGLENIDVEKLSMHVGEIGFTYDFPYEPSPHRPFGYNEHNLQKVKSLKRFGVKTMAQIPLIKQNVEEEIIEEIYKNLTKYKIDKVLLMRFSESGRGKNHKEFSITQKEINDSVKNYKEMMKKYLGPEIKLTPSIKSNLVGRIFSSLNISNEGLLLSNPWSYEIGGGFSKDFILGDLTKEKFSSLGSRNIYQRFFLQLRRNLK